MLHSTVIVGLRQPALTVIEGGRSAVFDPNVADTCLRLFREKGCAIPAWPGKQGRVFEMSGMRW